MGSSQLSIPQSPEVVFTLTTVTLFSKSTSKSYYISFYKNFQKASPNERQYLISEILTLFLESFPNIENLNEFIEYYFYNQNSIQTNLGIIRDKKTNDIISFSVYYYTEFYFLPNNKSKENRYIADTMVGVISKSSRIVGLQSLYYKTKALMDFLDYPDCNLLHFNVSINPLAYYAMCKSYMCVFPSYNQTTTKTIEDYLDRLFLVFNIKKYNDSPFLAFDNFDVDESRLETAFRDFEKWTGHLKFYVDITGLKKNVGLGFIALNNMIKGNTLGVEGKNYLFKEIPDVEVSEIVFKDPKI